MNGDAGNRCGKALGETHKIMKDGGEGAGGVLGWQLLRGIYEKLVFRGKNKGLIVNSRLLCLGDQACPEIMPRLIQHSRKR